jgi:hypothetical protein
MATTASVAEEESPQAIAVPHPAVIMHPLLENCRIVLAQDFFRGAVDSWLVYAFILRSR